MLSRLGALLQQAVETVRGEGGTRGEREPRMGPGMGVGVSVPP